TAPCRQRDQESKRQGNPEQLAAATSSGVVQHVRLERENRGGWRSGPPHLRKAEKSHPRPERACYRIASPVRASVQREGLATVSRPSGLVGRRVDRVRDEANRAVAEQEHG